MSFPFRLSCISRCVFTVILAALAVPGPVSAAPTAVPTFQSISLYWAPPGASATNAAKVEFKLAGAPETSFRRGLDLWYDTRTIGTRSPEYRGSLVELDPGTSYDIRLTLASGFSETLSMVSTWSETFPEGQTVTVPAGTTTLTINAADSGTPTAYKVYTAPPGQNVIDGSSNTGTALTDSCIVVNGASYVIIRGLVLRNCAREGILLEPDSHDIVIEDNDISGWGGGTATSPTDADSAVYCDNFSAAPADRVNRVVIQRNKLHDPRFSANPWGPNGTHPGGPQGVYFNHCGTNHVIRYNEVSGAASGHHFNDGIGGADNFTLEGFPFADSDIHGNKISEVRDDGIESEGANQNVRIWGNYLNNTFVGIANAVVSIGPIYVWRNVSNVMGGQWDPTVTNTDNDPERGPFVKAGGGACDQPAGQDCNGGRAYYLHNTILQPPPVAGTGATLPIGAADGLSKTGGVFYNFVSRNNIWHIYRPVGSGSGSSIRAGGDNDPTHQASIDVDFDLFNGDITVDNAARSEPNGKKFTSNDPPPLEPRYANSTLGDSGNYQLASNSVGFGNAQPLFNFNDEFAQPDRGAHQSGTPPMQFGVPPKARLAATPTSGNAPLAVSFDATASSAGSYPIASYSINFGDGSAPATTSTANHSYAAAGAYTATLTVTATNGAQGTASQAITVTTTGGATPPTAHMSATPQSGNAPLTVAFSGASSTAGSAAITTYNFNFGDGSSSGNITASSASHTYSSAGNFVAVLTITDANGNQSTDSKTVSVTTAGAGTTPSAFELFLSVDPGLFASRAANEPFNISVIAADGRALQSARFFVDNVLKATATAPPFQFTWTTAAGDTLGNHALRVEVTDTAGNLAFESRSPYVLSSTCDLFGTGTSIVQGQPLTVQGICSSAASVQQVEFYIDGVLQSTDTTSPYSWIMDTSAFAVGTHTVSITARLAAGAANQSSSVQITAAPLALSVSPSTSVMWNEQYTFSASASDGRALKQVDFFVDGNFMQGVTVPPFQYNFQLGTALYGRHLLLVQATDFDGNVLSAMRELYSLTRTCNVLVGTSKYLVGNGDTVYAGTLTIPQGQAVTVQALCSGVIGVQQVEFYLDNALQSTDTSSPYTWVLGTSGLAVGNHTIGITGRLLPSGASNHSITIEIIVP